MGEGTVPKGPVYDAQNPTKNGKSSGSSVGVLDFKSQLDAGFGADALKKHFGLESVSEDKAYSEGSTTGTKQTDGLDTYMTEENFKNLRNNDKVWDAYAKVYGKDKMEDKRESEEDGLSINALDGLMDKLSIDEKKSLVEEKPNEPIKHSPEIQQAKDRIRTYEEDIMSGRTSRRIFNEGEFDKNKGEGGIGTEAGTLENRYDLKAAISFMDAKTDNIKEQYQFKPAEYGKKFES
jgi:hypothetical protein